jgi:hypothetical protein
MNGVNKCDTSHTIEEFTVKYVGDFMKLLVALFSNFVKFLNISVNSWIPLVKQWLRELTEHFRDFMKSLVSQIYCNSLEIVFQMITCQNVDL